MLKLITNEDYITPKHPNDISTKMYDMLFAWDESYSIITLFTPAQVKRIRRDYKSSSFISYQPRNLSNEAKNILNKLKDLNKAYLEAVDREQAPGPNLDIIHFETESLRLLRSNLANYGKRKAKTAQYRNTRHPNKRGW